MDTTHTERLHVAAGRRGDFPELPEPALEPVSDLQTGGCGKGAERRLSVDVPLCQEVHSEAAVLEQHGVLLAVTRYHAPPRDWPLLRCVFYDQGGCTSLALPLSDKDSLAF